MHTNTTLHTQRQSVLKRTPIEEFRQTQQNYSRWSGLARPDGYLLTALALLLMIGLVMVTSASIPKAGIIKDGWIYAFTVKQMISLGIGLVVGFMIYLVPTQIWYNRSYHILLLSIILLLSMQIPGLVPEINHAKRWIPVGPIYFQTSEFVRIGMIIYAAAFLQRYQNQIHKSFLAMMRLILVLGGVCYLLLKQPDFGSAAVICCIVLGMMFLAGVCLVRFSISAVAIGVIGAYELLSADYRIERLQSYLHDDPLSNMFSKENFQIANSLIAISRGQLTGVGIGESLEKHAYLPEAHTDFIFSILAEETGLLGVIILMLLFAMVVWRAFVIANNADRVRMRFASCIAYGTGLWIGMQSLINMGVACSLLPTKGLTLPLISYGGSSLIASLMLLAILLRIDSESRYLLQQENMTK